MTDEAQKPDPEKTDPIPVRFSVEEDAELMRLKAETGLSKSELIRRCVRLLVRETKRRNDTTFIASLVDVHARTKHPPPKLPPRADE